MRISDWSSDVCSSDLNRGMILHDAGRDTEARLQLRESLRLREAMPGDHQGLLGDTLRLLGETSIGLGDHATAERQLRQSVTLAQIGRESCRERVCPYV